MRFLSIFAFLFSVNAYCCDANIDIRQKGKENIVVVEIAGQQHTLLVQESLSDVEVQSKIAKWFKQIVKENCK